jgi:hypothetical protein
MFASVYTYGHLVLAAFSLTMAFAFALSALRVPNARADWWYVLTFLLTATAGVTEMALSMAPTLQWARAYIVSLAIMILFLGVGFHAQYGTDVFDVRQRRLHRYAVIGTIVFAVASVTAIEGGFLDGGSLHAIEFHGARSAGMALSPGGFAFLCVYVAACSAVLTPLFLRRGMRAAERRLVAVPIVFIPVIGAYELTIGLGVNHYLPIGGYFAALAGLTGAFVLAERFRSLVHGGSVGGWQLERRLGGGGMADVYLARRTGARGVVQRVALKRLRPEYAQDPQFVEQFLAEARLIARLAHPNIVALTDVGEAAHELFLAMELVDGPSLARLHQIVRLRHQKLDPCVAVEVGVQIADALAYAHTLTDEQGKPLELIHRDVSPQNILITSTGHAKLADFGIARSADRGYHTSTGLLKGKLAYMAPEQVAGASDYDQRVDLWALGVVLFELLTNQRAYQAESDPALLKLYVEKRPPQLEALHGAPKELVALIVRLLSPEPAQRIDSAAALRDALQKLRDEGRARIELARLARELGAQDPADFPADAATVSLKPTE